MDCTRAGSVQYSSVDEAVEIGLYLPPCYDADLKRTYPVLYLLPGFGGSTGDWFNAGLAAMVDDLILTGEVPPLIVVTTDNSFDDLDASFLVQQVIPYLDSHYQTSQKRQHRAIAGGSLGGASAYHLAFKFPTLFSSAGIFGNGAAEGEEGTIRSWLEAISEAERPRVFLNCGQKDSYMLERALGLIRLLDEAGVEHTEIFSEGNHSYAYWLRNIPAYLNWLAQDW